MVSGKKVFLRAVALVGALFVGLQVHDARADAHAALALSHSIAETLDTADSLTIRRAKPIRTHSSAKQLQVALGNASISNSAWTEFPATDIHVDFQGASNAQELTVTNRETAGVLCLATTSRLSDTPKATDCNATVADLAAVTCGATPASTDAPHIIPAGTQRTFSFGGDECIFYMHSTSNGDGNFHLSVR